MNGPTDPSTALVQRWNDQYFGGQLSRAALDLMQPAAGMNDEAAALVERCLRWCRQAGIGARDVTLFQAWCFGQLLPKLVPSAWGGLIPPVTREGRHRKIDEYVAWTPWRTTRAGGTFLDIGCGLPPITTLDTARRFMDWSVIGVDPEFHPYMVWDASGDYACLDREGRVAYFQAGTDDSQRWDALYADKPATIARFEGLAAELRAPLDALASGEPAAIERAGIRLEKNPIRRFERPNLRFERGHFGALGMKDADVARSFNVLVYFDSPFRSRALESVRGALKPGGLFICGVDWVDTAGARYTVYRKERETLVEKEFAFSADNIRPISPVSLIAFHDQDYETQRLAEMVSVLRSDNAFRQRYDTVLDRILSGLDICPRGADGYLGATPQNLPSGEFERRFADIDDQLSRAGTVDAAVEALRRQGFDAWRNCVGHIAVAPSTGAAPATHRQGEG